MPVRHLWTIAALPLLALLVQAPARASVPSGLNVSLTLVTGASIPVHGLVTTGVTAPASHTSSHAHLKAHRRLHHHHRALPHPVQSRSALEASWPAPSPRHHGMDHRAALPGAVTGFHRGPAPSKQSAAVPAFAWEAPVPSPAPVASETGRSIARLEGRTISGRGPPRGISSVTSRPPRSHDVSPTAAAPPVPTVTFDLEPDAAPIRAGLRVLRPHPALRADPAHPVACTRPQPALPAGAASARPHRDSSPDPAGVRSRFETETVLDRSLVRRPEGTTACFDPPSAGEDS